MCVFAFLLPFILIPSVAYFQQQSLKLKGKFNPQPLELLMHLPLLDAAIVLTFVMLISFSLK